MTGHLQDAMSETVNETSPATGEEGDPLDKIVRLGSLIDLYGGLLTERQSTFIRAHYEDDLSFGEIARTHGVSRQAVHDAVKHAEASLEEYESKLRLLDRGMAKTGQSRDREAAAGALPSVPPVGDPPMRITGESSVPPSIAAAAAKLRDIRDRMRRSGGVIYNADGLAREIDQVADELEKS